MTIKVIVDLKAHPGRRDELQAVFESMLAAHDVSRVLPPNNGR
jgi:hypothetical protein